MSAPLLLVAEPKVWQNAPDDIPQLLVDIKGVEPEAIILLLPRGLAAPSRVPYLSEICAKIRELSYVVEWREMRIDGRKCVVVVAQDIRRGRRPDFPHDFGHLVLANS